MHIMKHMGRSKGCVCHSEKDKGEYFMERVYKVMNSVGAANIVIGIILVVTGLSAGIITIVNGARLLAGKKEITF